MKSSMYDLNLTLANRPGALAAMGEALGRAGVSVEGGGAWVVEGAGGAHFLVTDGGAARAALEQAGITVNEVREVLVQKLDQDVPGQLGKFTRRLADAGVNIEVLYSDHAHQLVLVVDNLDKGRAVSAAWMAERGSNGRTDEMKPHEYQVTVEWTGNTGTGTETYQSYARDHVIRSAGKPEIVGSSDPAFRGDALRYSPEETIIASLSACHMLWYLHLCSANRIKVMEYRDSAMGRMELVASGSGRFVQAQLRPSVRISADSDVARACALHEEAHRFCFIANSVNFPVEIDMSDVRRK